MSVIAKIDPNSPVRNGGATVATGGAAGHQTYCRDEVPSYASGDALGTTLNIDSRFRAGPWASDPYQQTTGDTRTSGSGTSAALFYEAPGVNRLHVLYGLGFGYSASPSGGALSVESPSGTVVWGPLPVTASGPGFMDFEPPLRLPTNQSMRLVLSASPGAAATISLKGRRVE